MWLIHFPLNNILIFIFPLFFFLFYLHETDNDLQTADLERKPGPATYKGPGNPWSHFPSVLLKRKKKCQWLSSVFIICCQKNNLNTLFWAFYWKVFFDKFLEIFISQNSMANSVTFCEHCGFRNISLCLGLNLPEKSGSITFLNWYWPDLQEMRILILVQVMTFTENSDRSFFYY